MDLRIQSINGVKWTTFSTVFKAILQIIQLMILARFLDKSDFGILAILMLFVSFSQVFVDFGIGKAIVHYQNISRRELSTLYWINILFGFLTYFILFLVSGFIADFYNEPLLSGYINLIGLVLIIQSFGLQFDTLFQKSLSFNVIAKIEIVATTVSFMAALLLVFNGFGIFSLIYPIIIMASIKALLLISFGLKYHKPQFIFRIKEISKYISFGSYSVGNAVVSNISAQMDTILIGKFLGTEILGLYSILKELILRPSQIISPIVTKVAFPTMSKVNNDLKVVKNMYLKIINYVSSITFPIYIATIILAPEIISIFLGEKWLEGVLIFQILAIWAMFFSIGNPVGSLVMAVGKPQVEMYWNIVRLFYMPLVIYISSFWGEIGIVVGMLIISVLLYIPAWYFLVFKLCEATLKEYFNSSFKALYISVIVGIFVYISIQFVPNVLYIKLSFGLILGAVLIFFLNKYLNRDFYEAMIGMVKR